MTETMTSRQAEALLPLGHAAIQGVSVREADGSVDFERVRDAGFSVVYLRATAGDDYVDCRLNANARAADAAGLDIGFFHYLTARTAEAARAQAEFFLSAVERHGAAMRPAMLFDRFRGMDVATINAVGEAFLSTVAAATGVAPMLKASAQSANLIWYRDLAQRYPLWVVDPNVAAPAVTAGKWAGWTGWEYAEYGTVEGAGELPLSLFTPDARIDAGAGGDTKLICVTVAYGDTLTAIARLFNTSVNAIVRLNGIDNPDLIFPGQRLYLRVPASTPVACCDRYTVRRGDTLTAIAARFGTTVDRLVAINQIPDEDLITVGQSLTLGLCPSEN